MINPDHISFWRGTLKSVHKLAPGIVRVTRIEGCLWWKKEVTLDFRYWQLGEFFVHIPSGIVLRLAPEGVWQALMAAMDP